VPGDLRACVKRAWEIRQALLSTGTLGMKVVVEPEQIQAPAGAPAIDGTDLRVGQPLASAHYDGAGYAGPSAIAWPGDDPTLGASVSMPPSAKRVSAERTWGLFHIIDGANEHQEGGNE